MFHSLQVPARGTRPLLALPGCAASLGTIAPAWASDEKDAVAAAAITGGTGDGVEEIAVTARHRTYVNGIFV